MFRFYIILTVILLISPAFLNAAIIVDPDGVGATNFEPLDPVLWTDATDGYIGYSADGALLVDEDSDLLSYNGTLGYEAGAQGHVTVDGVGSTWQDLYNLYVGKYGSGILNVTNGATVGSYDARIAVMPGSTGSVCLEGVGSRWTNSSDLNVGYAGMGELMVTQGATVHSGYDGVLGHLPGSSGTMTVDGIGSAWTNSASIYVGGAGEGFLYVSNGATVQNEGDSIIGNESGSTGLVQVDGFRSAWTNTGTLSVGQSGNGTLKIFNGAAVNSNDGHIGFGTGSTGLVKVDGPLSTWNTDSICVGDSGNGTLQITRGATVSNNSGTIGYATGSTGTVTVDGPLSAWINDGPLVIGRNSNAMLNITNGGLVSTSNLSLGSGGRLNLDGGTLELTGSMNFYNWAGILFFKEGEIKVSNGTIAASGTTSLGGNRTLTVTGVSSRWECGTDIRVGVSGVSEGTASLDILHGASLSNALGIIGATENSTGAVTVDGFGSTWINSNLLSVGDLGNATLDITNGATVKNTTGFIGNTPSSTGQVTVDGIGSTWTNTNELFVGHSGEASLVVAGGAVISNKHGFVAFNNDSNGSVTVDGIGSIWNNDGNLVVGHQGDASLAITNGATVHNSTAFIGNDGGGDGVVIVDGIGSTWDNAANLTIGQNGNGTLQINNGGTVNNIAGMIAFGQNSTSSVTVEGDNSIWNNNDTLTVGETGNGALHIAGGGTVSVGSSLSNSDQLTIGNNKNSVGSLTVEGEGSTLNLFAPLVIGKNGTGTLKILNGGKIESTYFFDDRYACIGSTQTGSGSGAALVDGEGSTWNQCGVIQVNGNNSSMQITNGGTVTSGDLGDQYGSHIDRSASVWIDGTGSTWTNYGEFHVGDYGSGALQITNGGTLQCTNISKQFTSYIAYGSVVNVNGAGSTWTNTAGILVGANNCGTLNITDGGIVRTGTSNTSYYSKITYGSVVNVDGEGSAWLNNAPLVIHGNGNNKLNITNGGLVSTKELYIEQSGVLNLDGGILELTGNSSFGDWPGTFNFANGEIRVSGGTVNVQRDFTLGENQLLTVSGCGSQWNNTAFFFIDGESLRIENGGKVNSNSPNIIGNASGSTGIVTVDGIDKNFYGTQSNWHCIILTIGGEGNGILDITNGGTVFAQENYLGQAAGSTGTVTVSGTAGEQNTPSRWDGHSLYVGNNGNGTLRIVDDGKVYMGYYNFLGYGSGSTGIATVEGTGSTWNAGSLTVGREGNGTLEILGGGKVIVSEMTQVGNGNGTIHFDGGTLNTGTLDAADASLTGTGTIELHDLITDSETILDSPDDLLGLCRRINSEPDQNIAVNWKLDGTSKLGAGATGNGSLTITNGLAATSQYGYIGRNASATGTVTVEGPGSTWSNGSILYVGEAGSGTLHVKNDAAMQNSTAYLGYNPGSTGTAVVEGNNSNWHNSSFLYVAYNGNGTLEITDGATLTSKSQSYIGYSSSSTGTVTVDGTGSTWTNKNDLYVGDDGRGTLEITNGGLVSAARTLTIDDDADGDAFINMATGGMLALFGEADDSLTDFLGLIKGTDAIRYWDDSIADWTNITGATLGTDYTLQYLLEGEWSGYTLLTVQKTSFIPGDANGDGRVDGSDVTILAGNWQYGVGMENPVATWAMGDFNGDGKIDGSDVTILAGNWQAGVTATAASVPEPSVVVLLLISTLCLANLQRRRQNR